MTGTQADKSAVVKMKPPKLSPEAFGYGLLIICGIVVLLMLQHRYWHGEFGHERLTELKKELREQERINLEQRNYNAILRADVEDLKTGLGAIEEHARLDLGLIKPGETFVQLSVAPNAYSRQKAVGVDSKSAVEPVDALIPDGQ
ncbi:septum formation initiator family protein [Moraxella oblonga]|uniref:septum formation initiator family protein n=1 Tax=Moraxella oblonga TaxID=200413 RepID=UPI000A9CD204|nr:septum formation initiator family protein [Moraxella oblonga]